MRMRCSRSPCLRRSAPKAWRFQRRETPSPSPPPTPTRCCFSGGAPVDGSRPAPRIGSKARTRGSTIRTTSHSAGAATGSCLAVAQRRGSIAIFERGRGEQNFAAAPTFEITGPKARLQGSDGVAFLPPNYEQLAVCNLEGGTITFYRMSSRSPLRFDVEPSFELKHPTLVQPDGLAFTSCGAGWPRESRQPIGERLPAPAHEPRRRRDSVLVESGQRDRRPRHALSTLSRILSAYRSPRRDQRGRQLFQHLHPDWPRTRPPLVATTGVASNRRCRQRIPRRERDQQDGRRSKGRGCLREPPGDMHTAARGEDLPTGRVVAGVATVAVSAPCAPS